MSCGAACARQLLLDAQIDVPESMIRAEADFDPVDGIGAGSLAKVLTKLHPGVRYASGAVFPEHLNVLASRVPFLALLRIHSGRHWIIVDKIEGDDVHVRDPGGQQGEKAGVGVEAIMKLRTFHERWRLAVNGTVYRL